MSLTTRPGLTSGIHEGVEDVIAAQARAALRDARLAAGLTQTELARRAGITRAQVQIMESDQDRWNPGIRLLYAVAQALDISVHDLIPDVPGSPRP